MESNPWEHQRYLLEEIDRLEQMAADELVPIHASQKQKLSQEYFVSSILNRIQSHKDTLNNLLKSSNSLHSLSFLFNNSLLLTANSSTSSHSSNLDLGDFYKELKALKNHHRNHNYGPDSRLTREIELEATRNEFRLSDTQMEAKFSGEEHYGKYLDLIEVFNEFLNLKNQSKIDYFKYIKIFDDFDQIVERRSDGEGGERYLCYLERLSKYLENFIERAMPLFMDMNRIKESSFRIFEQICLRNPLFCHPCSKTFTNQAVYENHLNGKKHLKALERNSSIITTQSQSSQSQLQSSNSNPIQSGTFSREGRMIYLEILTRKLGSVLSEIREDTRSNIELRQSRTLAEREEDRIFFESLEDQNITAAENVKVNSSVNNSDYGRIYNPLNLPLDWDGKPIPYWLWKLHGLGVKYSCEICGGHVYSGRKAFDQHFFEWRHSHGLKSLGIPNTKHFFQIVNIEDATKLWDKMRQEARKENFRSDAMEEFEDQYGNVYSKKMYEDLRKQGLL